MSGPLWAGPLHDAAYLKEMLNLAEQWAWVGSGSGTGTDLEKLLKQMIDESDPRLPFGYIKLDEVSFHPEITLVLVCAIQLQFICKYVPGGKPCENKFSTPKDHDGDLA